MLEHSRLAMRLVQLLLALAAGAALPVGCSAAAPLSDGPAKSESGPRSTAGAIQGGAADGRDQYGFAVGIYLSDVICSGALIAPNVVLTARHCVDASPEQVECGTSKFGARRANEEGGIRVTTGASFFDNSGSLYSSTRIVTPDDTELCGNDIALIVLDRTVPTAEAVPVIPAILPAMTDARYSHKITAIGFGVTGPGADDSAGVRRSLENIPLVCISGDPNAKFNCLATPGLSKQVSAREFIALDGGCQGDSGSSAFEQNAFSAWKAGNGTPVTLGVLSRGGEQGGRCLGGVYTRVDAFSSLVVTTVSAAALTGNYPMPAWAAMALANATAPSATASAPGSTSAGGQGGGHGPGPPGGAVGTGSGVAPNLAPSDGGAPGAAPTETGHRRKFEASAGCDAAGAAGARGTEAFPGAVVVLAIALVGARLRARREA